MSENLNLQYQIFSKSDMINWLNESNDIQSVILRYPKPILCKIINSDLIPKELIYKYPKELGRVIGVTYRLDKYYSTEDNQGYFWVRIKPLINEKIQKQIKENIIKAYDTKHSSSLYVNLNQLESFLKEYHRSKDIDISHLSCSLDIDWSNELITNFKDFWKWDDLQRNESITWNFDLIGANIDKLNWAHLYNFASLLWSTEYISKYIDYIVFSSKTGENKKGFKYFFGNSLDNTNKHSRYCGSISLSHYVQWSKELIDCFNEYWDWEDLCINDAIEWNIDLITLYYDRVNFDSLSKNKGLKWSISLIEYFLTRWNWNFLSLNPSLPWSDEFIEKFDSYWVWRDDKITYKKVNNLHESINCISANKAIKWSLAILSKYSKDLDFWLISLYGNFEFEALEKFSKKFDEKRIVDVEVHRFSDWGTETAEVYRTGWENLALNTNVFLSPSTIGFFYSTFIEITVINGNFADNGFHKQISINLLEVLRNNEIADFDLIDIINHELSWGNLLINDNFINQSLFDKCIKGMINNTFLTNYLAKLYD